LKRFRGEKKKISQNTKKNYNNQKRFDFLVNSSRPYTPFSTAFLRDKKKNSLSVCVWKKKKKKKMEKKTG
jgi:hypothetical protein